VLALVLPLPFSVQAPEPLRRHPCRFLRRYTEFNLTLRRFGTLCF
jgi:hypothetical protein